MTPLIQSCNKTTRKTSGAAAALSCHFGIWRSSPTRLRPLTSADLIGAAMAVQMGQYHGGYIPVDIPNHVGFAS